MGTDKAAGGTRGTEQSRVPLGGETAAAAPGSSGTGVQIIGGPLEAGREPVTSVAVDSPDDADLYPPDAIAPGKKDTAKRDRRPRSGREEN